MPVTRNKINRDLSRKKSATSLIDKSSQKIDDLKEAKLVNNATVLGREVGQTEGPFESLEQKLDFAGQVNTEGDVLTRTIQNPPNSVQDAVLNFPNDGFDADAITNDIDTLLNADSDTDLTGMFSSVGSIGGGVADTVSGVIRIITLLGALSKIASNISISGSATDAIKASGKALSEKANNLGGALSEAAGSLGDLGDVNSLSDLSGAVSDIGSNFGEVGSALSAFTKFNPDAGVLGQVTNIAGAGEVVGDIDDQLGVVNQGVNDIENTVDNFLDAGLNGVVNKVFGEAQDILGPVNETVVKSAGGIAQNINEAANQEFTKKVIQFTGGASVSNNLVSGLMDRVASDDPKQIAQATKSITQISNRIPDSMRSIVNSVNDNEYNSSRELLDNIIDRAERQNVDVIDRIRFIEQFNSIEDTLPTLDTTIQSSLIRTNNQFFTENVNLKDYAANYPAVGDIENQEVPEFTTVDSKEELGQEMMLIKRGVLYLTLHATQTFNNQFLTSADIHRDHIERGLKGIQYHYIIRRDGTVERGLPADRVSELSPRNLRNFTIDIALVGGINASSGVENPDQYKSIESYTRAQMDTLESFIDSFYRKYPGGIVQGHSQVENEVDDPNFDVSRYIRNRFNR